MGLLDTVVEYFENALEIRGAELGTEHFYTVKARSNLGGVIAAQVIQGEILRQKRWKKTFGFDGDQIPSLRNSVWQNSLRRWAMIVVRIETGVIGCTI